MSLESDPPKPPIAPENSSGKRSLPGSPLFVWLLALVLAAPLFFGLDYLVSALAQETTDDAYIAGHIVSIAPRIAGQVVAVHVLDNQLVHSNDLLVEIDPADYAMTAAQKQSAADAQESSYKLALAGFELERDPWLLGPCRRQVRHHRSGDLAVVEIVQPHLNSARFALQQCHLRRCPAQVNRSTAGRRNERRN